jgi:hypothetical protein
MNIGAGWKKTTSAGKEIISIKFMDNVWLNLFPKDKTNDKQPDYDLVWQSDYEKKKKQEKQSDNKNVPDGLLDGATEVSDSNIPF